MKTNLWTLCALVALVGCQQLALKDTVSQQVSDFTGANQPATGTAPTITSSTPADQATVSTGLFSTLTITFSAAVTGATQTGSYLLSGAAVTGGTNVGIASVLNTGNRTYTLTLSGSLGAGALLVTCPGVRGASGNAVVSDTLHFTLDTTAPGYTVASSSADTYFPHVVTGAVVTFSKAVVNGTNKANYTVSGAGKGSLAVTSVSADAASKVFTLTFSGSPATTAGSIVITALSGITDQLGNMVTQTGGSLPYDPSWYVATTGSDSADGTSAHPLATVDKAVATVKALAPTFPVDIRVADGTYNPVLVAGTSATVDLGTSGNINLKGSYDSSFAKTNKNGNTVLVVNDASFQGTVVALRASGVVDGITLKYSSTKSMNEIIGIGIGAPNTVVENCILQDLSPVYDPNQIKHFGIVTFDAKTQSGSYDGSIDMTGVKIINNVILPGGDKNSPICGAIYASGSFTFGNPPYIGYNVLLSGAAAAINATTWGIESLCAGLIIEGNIIESEAQTSSDGGLLCGTAGAGVSPGRIRNNAFYLNSGATLIKYLSAMTLSATNITQEQLAGSGIAMNKALNDTATLNNRTLSSAPSFIDTANLNYRLTSPTGLTGTLNTGDDIATKFQTDADGKSRGTTTWTLGAYQ